MRFLKTLGDGLGGSTESMGAGEIGATRSIALARGRCPGKAAAVGDQVWYQGQRVRNFLVRVNHLEAHSQRD
jgi:hypothetical protein